MKLLKVTALILVLSALLAFESSAADKESWFCTDDQAMKTGNTFIICGVGTSDAEGGARTKALDNAVNEFKTVCELSSDCKGKSITVEPKRSSCSITNIGWDRVTCHRMFLFTVQ